MTALALPLLWWVGVAAAGPVPCPFTAVGPEGAPVACEDGRVDVDVTSFVRLRAPPARDLYCVNVGEAAVALRARPVGRAWDVEGCRAEGPQLRCGDPVALVCTIAEPPPATERPGDAKNRPSVYVQDIEPIDAPAAVGHMASNLVTVHLSRLDEIDVASSEDVRAWMEDAAAGTACSPQDPSCAQEIAGAVGARFLVTGRVARVGRMLDLRLFLFDTETKDALSQIVAEVSDVAELNQRLPDLLHNLLAPAFDWPVRELPPAPHFRAPEDDDSLWGAAVAGVGAGGGVFLCLFLPFIACWVPEALLLAGAIEAGTLLILPVVLAFFGAPFAVVLAAVGAMLGDKLFGYPISFWRVAASSASTCGGAGMLFFALSMGTILGAVYADASQLSPVPLGLPVTALVTGICCGAGTGAVGVASALLFDVGVALFEPRPDPLAPPEWIEEDADRDEDLDDEYEDDDGSYEDERGRDDAPDPLERRDYRDDDDDDDDPRARRPRVRRPRADRARAADGLVASMLY